MSERDPDVVLRQADWLDHVIKKSHAFNDEFFSKNNYLVWALILKQTVGSLSLMALRWSYHHVRSSPISNTTALLLLPNHHLITSSQIHQFINSLDWSKPSASTPATIAAERSNDSQLAIRYTSLNISDFRFTWLSWLKRKCTKKKKLPVCELVHSTTFQSIMKIRLSSLEHLLWSASVRDWRSSANMRPRIVFYPPRIPRLLESLLQEEVVVLPSPPLARLQQSLEEVTTVWRWASKQKPPRRLWATGERCALVVIERSSIDWNQHCH